LSNFNIVSKSTQKVTFDTSDTIELFRNCKTFLENYRESGFSDALKSPKDLAALSQVKAQFKPVRIRRRKKQFTYECDDEIPDVNDHKNISKIMFLCQSGSVIYLYPKFFKFERF